MTKHTPLLALLGLTLLAPLHAADRLVTKDGRILEVRKARELPDGRYRLEFEGGVIECSGDHVASVEIEGDMSDYVPANEDEAKKLEMGYVRYRGKWLSKPAYQAELEKVARETRERTAELEAHSRFHDGWEKQTKHFDIKTNTSPELLEYYAELLETYYDMMDKRVGIDPSPSLKRTKMKVCVYKNRPEFTRITKVDPGVAGFFNFVDGELHFYHDYEDPSVSDWVALHEGTHLLTFLVEPQARPGIWINEGVADYFGSATISRDKRGRLEIEPGRLSLERVLTVQQAIADGTYIPLETLFKITRDEFHAFEYAHAWSFVYFLNESDSNYRKGFTKFFKDFYTIAKGVEFDLEPGGGNKYGSWKIVPPDEIRRLLLDKLKVKDVAALESEWLEFVTAIPIDAPVARYKRALGVFRGDGEMQPALEDLDAAIDSGLEVGRAFWARAAIGLMVRADRDAALADLRRALELEPLDAGYRSNLAQMLSGMPFVAGGITLQLAPEGKLTGSDEELSEAEAQFALACALAPENDTLREAREEFLTLLSAHAGR